MKLRSLTNVIGFLPSGKPFKRQPVDARRPTFEDLVARRERMLRLSTKDLADFRMWVEDADGNSFLAPRTAFAERWYDKRRGVVRIQLTAKVVMPLRLLSMVKCGVLDDEGYLISERLESETVMAWQTLALKYELTGRV